MRLRGMTRPLSQATPVGGNAAGQSYRRQEAELLVPIKVLLSVVR